MEEIDILLVIARVAVAIGVIATLATVIDRQNQRPDRLLNSIRLRNLLDGAICITFIASIAVLLLKVYGLNPQVWQASSIVGLFWLAAVAWFIYKRHRLRRQSLDSNKLVGAINFGVIGVALTGYLIISTGLVGALGFPVFVAALLLSLAGCFTLFVLVMSSLAKA